MITDSSTNLSGLDLTDEVLQLSAIILFDGNKGLSAILYAKGLPSVMVVSNCGNSGC